LPDICLGFEVHQPYRLRRDLDVDSLRGIPSKEVVDRYFDQAWNRSILRRVSQKCYLPANGIILGLFDSLGRSRRRARFVYSLSGVVVEQMERWSPDALESFRQLAESRCVEFLDQTYFHSLASLFPGDRGEFVEQVKLHRELMEELFGQSPKVFENTEFIYNDSIAQVLKDLGYRAVFTEGAPRVLGWRSPNYLYRARGSGILVLLRNHTLSDDVAFRFSAQNWPEWPLTADRYAEWLSKSGGDCINIFIDYETFGEHQWKETGIFEFLRSLPGEILDRDNLALRTASEIVGRHRPVGEISVGDFDTVSWADVRRDTSAWLGNDMQRTAFRAMRAIAAFLQRTGDPVLLKAWRYLQVSDHLYYMYTEPGASGIVHGYFSSQPANQAFQSFLAALSDLWERVASSLDEPLSTTARILRFVPPQYAFHFHEDGQYIDLSAHSLEEFRDVLRRTSDLSLLFHKACGHFEDWIRRTIGDDVLADSISSAKAGNTMELRDKLVDLVSARIGELVRPLYREGRSELDRDQLEKRFK